MPPRAVRPASQMSEIILPPSSKDSVAAPREKKLMKIAKGHTVRKPKNFDKALKRLKETGELSLDDFNNTQDIGAFLDFYNDTLQKDKEKDLNNDIVEISKLLAKMLTEKTIFMGGSKKD